MSAKFYCPCCGFLGLDRPAYERLSGPPPWGDLGAPPYDDTWGPAPLCDMCPCCGFQYGIDDMDDGVSFAEYLHDWISSGCSWLEPEAKPSGWSLDAQLAAAGIESPLSGAELRLASKGEENENVARIVFARARRILQAGEELRKEGGYESLSLHFLCTGIGEMLKAALLEADRDRYRPELKGTLVYKLLELFEAVQKECRLSARTQKPPWLAELETLDRLYQQDQLRVPSAHKMPATQAIRKRVLAGERLMNRYFSERG